MLFGSSTQTLTMLEQYAHEIVVAFLFLLAFVLFFLGLKDK